MIQGDRFVSGQGMIGDLGIYAVESTSWACASELMSLCEMKGGLSDHSLLAGLREDIIRGKMLGRW